MTLDDRIALVTGIVRPELQDATETLIHAAIRQAVNEALERAAAKCDALQSQAESDGWEEQRKLSSDSGTPTPTIKAWGFEEAAAAIRALKEPMP